MNNILIAMLGGGIGGVVGALLGATVARLFPVKMRSTVATIFSVALAIVGGQMLVRVMRDVNSSPSAIESQMLADPSAGSLVRAWKEAEPENYQAFLARLSAGARAGHTYGTLVNAARTQMLAAAAPRFLHLDDAQTLEMIQVAGAEFRELAQSHPQTCKPMFLGENFGDITPYLSAQLRAREVALMEAAFRANVTVERPMLRDAALSTGVETLITATGAKVGDDISLLANGADIRGREPRFCEVVAAMYDEMAAMPAADAASLMRGIRSAS